VRSAVSEGHYQQLSARNDEESIAFRRKIADRLHTIVPLLPNKTQTFRLLEIGCAEGKLGATLKAMHPMVYDGIEISRDAEIASTRIDNVYKSPAAELRVQPYDLIISFHLLEHISNPSVELTEWKRLLAPKGQIIIEVPNESGHPLITSDENLEHLHQFTTSSLLCLLYRVGFKVHNAYTGCYESAVYNDCIRVTASIRESQATNTARLISRIKQYMGDGPYLIYGIGGDFMSYVLPVIDQLPVLALLDSSPDKWGKKMAGHVISRYDKNIHANRSFLICTIRFKRDIEASLRSLGIPDHNITTLEQIYFN
jgi:ubiquinone/menaquinone biosynthesis C-methylase UbiE